MVCSWALVLIRQDSGCPSKETCEQDARENWQAAGPQRAAFGELLALLCWLAGLPHTHQGSRATPRPSCGTRFVLVMG